MENSFLYRLLIDPVTGDALELNGTRDSLRSIDGSCIYAITESVPKILTGENKSIGKADLHRRFKTDFRYLEHYEADACLFDYSEKGESKATRHEIRRLHETIINEIKHSDVIILDVGCGNGWAASCLVPKGNRVISMDISSKNPTEAMARTPGPNHAGLIADVYNIPFPDSTFDYVIASEILEHVPDPALFINILVRLLKPHGKLLVTTPYNEKIEYCLCVHCNLMTPRHAHLHSFNRYNIMDVLPSSGIDNKITLFSNKFISRLRFHLILQIVPFRLWRFIDRIANLLLGNETRMMIMIEKQ
jgi:SAM-dependent methyltransferase